MPLTRRCQLPRVQAGEGEAEARLVLVLSVARCIRDFDGVLKVFARQRQLTCFPAYIAQAYEDLALAVAVPDLAGDGQVCS